MKTVTTAITSGDLFLADDIASESVVTKVSWAVYHPIDMQVWWDVTSDIWDVLRDDWPRPDQRVDGVVKESL